MMLSKLFCWISVAGTFALFSNRDLYTDIVNLPFEDCSVPPGYNLVIWHTWLDDLIHLTHRAPDQIASLGLSTLQGDGFWGFVNRLRQGRDLVITSDHGNVEDLSHRHHTLNPVPTLVIGAARAAFGQGLSDLTHFAPAILSYLK